MNKKYKNTFRSKFRAHLVPLVLGALIVGVLVFNEDTSWKNNMEYQAQINSLRARIKECNDSSEWFRQHRTNILSGHEELEVIAREEYHMQKPTEDVYLIID